MERFDPDVQFHVHWALDDITAAGFKRAACESLEEDDYISPEREFNINEPVCSDRVCGKSSGDESQGAGAGLKR